MANLNPQAWAIPQIVIATPPTATVQEVNWYWQELINLCTGLTNVVVFIGFQHHVNLPDMLASALGSNASQSAIDNQTQTLNLYCVLLVNAQGLIVHLLNQNAQNVQNQPAPQSTIKAPKPEFDGTPGEKAHGFVTACTTYWTLQPNNFQNDEVFITWALVCIDDDSKAALWKAHWLTLRTENIAAGRVQPATLIDWDTFAHEFLGKFTNPSETQRMQRHLVEMRQKGCAETILKTLTAQHFLQEWTGIKPSHGCFAKAWRTTYNASFFAKRILPWNSYKPPQLPLTTSSFHSGSKTQEIRQLFKNPTSSQNKMSTNQMYQLPRKVLQQMIPMPWNLIVYLLTNIKKDEWEGSVSTGYRANSTSHRCGSRACEAGARWASRVCEDTPQIEGVVDWLRGVTSR